MTVDHARQQFEWRQGDGEWKDLGPELDASVISDEGGRGEHGSFTGAFVGMLCFDTTGQEAYCGSMVSAPSLQEGFLPQGVPPSLSARPRPAPSHRSCSSAAWSSGGAPRYFVRVRIRQTTRRRAWS